MSRVKYENVAEYIKQEVKLLRWYISKGHTEIEFVNNYAVKYELHHKGGQK